MQNPFLIARFIAFALLVNLNILVLAFAAWGVSAADHSNVSVSVTTFVFFIFESCALLIGVILGVAELLTARVIFSRVLYECVWTAILSVFQTGTAISVTLNFSGVCRLTDNWELCASSSLLIPVSWLSSIILFTYFLALLITVIAHVSLFPGVWTQSINSMDWCNLREPSFESKVIPETDTFSRYTKDVEATGSRSDNSTTHAPWVKTIRRGIDPPFKFNEPSAASSPTTKNSFLVSPLRVPLKGITSSRFIERFRESARLSRQESVFQMQSPSKSQTNPFPPCVENDDLPIPLPRLSEWIRADNMKGINIYDK